MLETVLNETSWIATKRYQSPEIVNEIMKLMGHKVLRLIISDIQFQKWYSLMADETRDVSNREQLVVTMRWVTETYKIRENFCGLLQVDETTSECIYMTLSWYLVSLRISFENCRGQAYNGASNF